MDVAKSIQCEELLEFDVIDSSGNKIGNIGDMVFKFKDEIELTHFVLTGSFWEEFLERIGARDDIDPVFDASLIKEMKRDKVVLNTEGNKLQNLMSDFSEGEGDFSYKKLKDRDIVDDDGVKVGKVVDIHFDNDGLITLLAGGNFVEELLEASGIKVDVDILVPGTTIKSIGDAINLRVRKDQLSSVIGDALRSPDGYKGRERRQKVYAHMSIFGRSMSG